MVHVFVLLVKVQTPVNGTIPSGMRRVCHRGRPPMVLTRLSRGAFGGRARRVRHASFAIAPASHGAVLGESAAHHTMLFGSATAPAAMAASRVPSARAASAASLPLAHHDSVKIAPRLHRSFTTRTILLYSFDDAVAHGPWRAYCSCPLRMHCMGLLQNGLT